jgi:uracil-DNA glycosylase family 4
MDRIRDACPTQNFADGPIPRQNDRPVDCGGVEKLENGFEAPARPPIARGVVDEYDAKLAYRRGVRGRESMHKPGSTMIESLHRLCAAITRCEACPRLVSWRRHVSVQKVARFRQSEYWGRPVPGFGDPRARILFVGLAPGAHGANRTGRMFTGDRSGDFLYAAMHRAGLANQPTSISRDDGLRLRDAYIVSTIRCAPPGNAPAPDEIERCAPFLDEESALLPNVVVWVALGAIAWRACVSHFARTGAALSRPVPAFRHGARVSLARAGTAGRRPRWLLGSYHVSQQNTQTGKLTVAMFDSVLAEAVGLVAFV